MSSPSTVKILITSGEPAGIGPDILLELIARDEPIAWAVLMDPELLAQRARVLGVRYQSKILSSPEEITPHTCGSVQILPVKLAAPVEAGVLNPDNGSYVLQQLQQASDWALAGRVDAIVTAPVNKAALCRTNSHFSGHTEFFQQAAGVEEVVMMLATPGLRMALATTHLPLRQVADAITAEKVTNILQVLHKALRQDFALDHPVIKVAGLNPHAGEEGHLGDEEIHIINPVIQSLQQQGVDVRGCYPADTLFNPSQLSSTDAFLAMYHDQGLPVLKFKGFGQAVNITLGLPYVRTSVDHGTALELAGTGKAKSTSLIYALQVAQELAQNRLQHGGS